MRVRVGNGVEEVDTADLVVDASGRSSSSPAWLKSFGFVRPEEERVEIGVGYTTRAYRRRPSDLNGKLAVVIAGSGPNWRNGNDAVPERGSMDRLDRRLFWRSCVRRRQMFAAYAGSLPTSEIHDMLPMPSR